MIYLGVFRIVLNYLRNSAHDGALQHWKKSALSMIGTPQFSELQAEAAFLHLEKLEGILQDLCQQASDASSNGNRVYCALVTWYPGRLPRNVLKSSIQSCFTLSPFFPDLFCPSRRRRLLQQCATSLNYRPCDVCEPETSMSETSMSELD